MCRKEQDVLRQIAKASDALCWKHRMLKLGKEAAQNILSETFKPIVSPLEKLVNVFNTTIKHDIEKEI